MEIGVNIWVLLLSTNADLSLMMSLQNIPLYPRLAWMLTKRERMIFKYSSRASGLRGTRTGRLMQILRQWFAQVGGIRSPISLTLLYWEPFFEQNMVLLIMYWKVNFLSSQDASDLIHKAVDRKQDLKTSKLMVALWMRFLVRISYWWRHVEPRN